MGLGKTYSTKYLLDSNNNSGVAGQVLSTTSTGIDWADANTLPGAGLWLESGNDIYNSNSANVGIGTTTPGSKLELWEVAPGAPTMLTLHGYALDTVADDTMGAFIDFKRTDNNASFTPQARIGMLIRDSNGDNGIISEGCGNLVFHTSRGTDSAGAGEDVERMRITDIGKVGIGTDDPTGKLMVRDDTAGAPTRLSISNGGTAQAGTAARLSFYEGATEKSYIERRRDGSGKTAFVTPADDNPFVWENPTGEIMRINNSNVGIGTTSPDSKLEVAGGSTGILLSNLGDSSGYDAVRMTYNGYNSGTPEFIFQPKSAPGSGTTNTWFRFKSLGTSPGVNVANVTVDGSVGIGTTSPGAKLHLAKTTTWGEMSNPIINIQNNGTGGNINTAHNMGSITWKSGTVSTAEIKAVRNTPASGDNVELRFSTSVAGVQGERMTIQNTGVVLINNSLGVNVTSVSTGYKLDIGGGDIYVRQAVAKISLGQFGSQGDAHFGASGIGDPTVGSQDYGFYSAHNAYRTATGAWKHSRTSTIPSVRLLGSGGVSSGNQGFSFDYSANVGTADITWTNLMQLSAAGNLQLPSYGAGTLVTDASGNITVSSGGGAGGPYLPVATPTFTGTLTGPNATFTGQLQGNDVTFGGEVIVNNNFVNYEFSTIENSSPQYWLLCYNAGANDVNGTIIGDRTSGNWQAMNLDIVISSRSAAMISGMMTSKQVLQSNEKYTLVTLTYNSVSYVAIKYEGNTYPTTDKAYFTGLLKSSIGANFLLALTPASVSAVSAFSNANTKATIQADKVGIGMADPLFKLHVNQGNTSGTVIKASGIQAQIEIETSTAGDAHLYMKPNSTGNNAAIFKMTAGTNYNWRWQDDATTPVVFMQLSQSNSSLSVKGDIIAYGSPSDERYKENIKPIESALDKVTKLQGVTFDWKESDNLLDIKEDIGFIAQDVQKIVPELVRENEDGKLSLRYQGITPILLEAIKELKAEIDLLKSKPCNCNNCNCNI